MLACRPGCTGSPPTSAPSRRSTRSHPRRWRHSPKLAQRWRSHHGAVTHSTTTTPTRPYARSRWPEPPRPGHLPDPRRPAPGRRARRALARLTEVSGPRRRWRRPGTDPKHPTCHRNPRGSGCCRMRPREQLSGFPAEIDDEAWTVSSCSAAQTWPRPPSVMATETDWTGLLWLCGLRRLGLLPDQVPLTRADGDRVAPGDTFLNGGPNPGGPPTAFRGVVPYHRVTRKSCSRAWTPPVKQRSKRSTSTSRWRMWPPRGSYRSRARLDCAQRRPQKTACPRSPLTDRHGLRRG